MPSHNVLPLQTILQTQGYAITALDGIFGTETRAAMRQYQAAHKLTVSDQPTRELCDSLGIDLGPDFPYQPLAPKGPSMLSLLPTIVQWIVALLPGIPDDIAIVEAELAELASTDSGKVKLQTALKFGQTLIAKIEAVLEAHP